MPKGVYNRTQNPPRRILAPNEVEGIKREIDQKNSMLQATAEFGDTGFSPALPAEVSVDKDKIKSSVAHLERVLRDEGPRRISSSERDRLVRRNKELEELFRDNLETWQDLGAIRMETPEYKAAFKKAGQRPKYERYIQEWKENCKLIEPEDPEYSSLDRIRKEK